MQTIEVRTNEKLEFINITSQVKKALSSGALERGLLIVFVPHTSAGITINENADPTVETDIVKDLTRLLPGAQKYYEHFEGNSASHTMASMVGSSITIIVEDGQLALGRWQGIFFCEFDGPRSRQVHVSWVGE